MDTHRENLSNCPHCKQLASNPKKYYQCIVCAQRYHIACYHCDIQVPHRAHFTGIICDRDRWRADALCRAPLHSPTPSAAASTERARSEATTIEGEGRAQQAAAAAAETPEPSLYDNQFSVLDSPLNASPPSSPPLPPLHHRRSNVNSVIEHYFHVDIIWNVKIMSELCQNRVQKPK